MNGLWWLETPHWAPRQRTEEYLERVGLLKREEAGKLTSGPHDERTHWCEVLVLQAYPMVGGKRTSSHWTRLCEKFGRAVKRDPELGEAMLTSFRLGGPAAVRAYVKGVVEPKPEPLSPEEQAAKRKGETAKVVARRRATAEAKLAEHLRLLRMEEKLVTKWRRKVQYYARKTGTV